MRDTWGGGGGGEGCTCGAILEGCALGEVQRYKGVGLGGGNVRRGVHWVGYLGLYVGEEVLRGAVE